MSMESIDLAGIVRDELEAARQASSGRAARTVRGGQNHALKQTVIALRSGAEMAEHNSPDEGTVQVLAGRVRLVAGPHAWEGGVGEMVVVPPQRHSLLALDDAVVLLTAVNR
ncbi:LuxR family transcriptional regulator [Aeromicrobium sp. IC_218]|jgi:quercetin dioxygenase-like cupin family protein|uniref:LuxR family transcriptional regulator n=1 Tax=Aeromicrobium sp. IC_218 TaxID=2545468 RepID=UPI001F608887|nr:LuxR family transcriptional regulator [Aeromicrobium sp. IC_218]